MKSNRKMVIFYVAFILLVVFAASMFANQSPTKSITYSDIGGYFKNEQVTSFVVDEENNIILKLKDNTIVKYRLKDFYVFYEDYHELINQQYPNIIKEYDYEPKAVIPWWVSFLPYVIVIIIMVVIWWVFISRASGQAKNSNSIGGLGGRMNAFSKARTKLGSEEKHKVLFSDVAGADEEKEELMEIVEFLKNPGKFSSLGAKIPRGVLLVGAPGTGKTLLAKAVAGEAGVPFYSISGSDFVEMYVGVGASRVRDLFETAKRSSPAIIFIDEIDAVGRYRGAGWGGGHDEREQTLNQLLVEMDGFGVNDGVIVIAATNRPDILDPALLRPGRFDRQITVHYPDIKGREEILKVHSRNKPLDEDVDLEMIARSTSGFTGADLANLMNEAALLAARKNKQLIGMEDIEEAEIKVIVGPQKKSRVIKEEAKRATAYHEAGHAIVEHLLPSQDDVHQVSIIPSGMALGYTISLPQEDKYSVYKQEMIEKIAVLLGGRVAEKLILHDISGGASNDIQRATEIARKMVTQYGMSETLGPIVFGTGHDEVFLGKNFSTTRNYSEKIAAAIDDEIHTIITKGYEIAEKLLISNMELLHFVAEYLVKYETMDRDQFTAVFEENPTFEKLLAIREEKHQKSKANNENKRKENQKRENEKRIKEEELKNSGDETNTTE
ncbi:MAG: ATP-dependent metallopeptidase FtsH/Yme1/Tma family protein [Clostridiales bacterium]|nr:ATP-dependent metallopeptidase FtsH/Yme1/Tma family protein [Clostridiales bacterium]